MSLFRVRASAYAIGPRVSVEGDRVVARAPAAWRLLSLGGWDREVVLDRRRREVVVRATRWWTRTAPRVVPFDDVDHLVYEFASLPTAYGRLGRTDQVERFTLALVRKGDRERIVLAEFVGGGSVGTGLLGVLAGGDSVVDVEGDQESRSLACAELFAATIGVALGPRVEVPQGIAGGVARCGACGRARPRREGRCLYCGAALGDASGREPFR